MRLSAKLGKALAISWLILLYPALSPLFHAHPSSLQVGGILLTVGLIVVVYVGFWLVGPPWATVARVTMVVIGLMLLGLGVNLVSGVWTINPFLLAILIAGFAYPFRLAVAAVSGLTAISILISLPALVALRLSTRDIVALDVITAFQLLLFGFAAVAISRLVATIRELRLAREENARLAVEHERARFARDLHDVMGHSLSVITLKGELAAQLIASAPEQASKEVHDIVRVARDALREVRETVSGYRQPTLATELAGAQAAFAAAGIECRLEQAAGALSPEAEAALAWTVREGATNVLRHSGARRCSVMLVRDDDSVRLDIVDDGRGATALEPGNGLRGLGERVREIDGRLEAEPLPHGGFRLRVTVPAQHVPASKAVLSPGLPSQTERNG